MTNVFVLCFWFGNILAKWKIVEKQPKYTFLYLLGILDITISEYIIREGIKKKIDFFLGKSPKLWVGGGQES